jgi:hypothetical protein
MPKENKYTSLEYTIASGDPFVRALTKNIPTDKQKAVWRRYAQIVYVTVIMVVLIKYRGNTLRQRNEND